MNTFEVICTLLNSIFNVLAAVFLYSIFADGRYSRFRYVAFIVFSVAFVSITEIFISNKLIGTALSLCITLALSFIYRMKWFNRILFACFSYALAGLADSITILLVSYIFEVDIQSTAIKSVIIMSIVWSKAILFLCILIIKALKRNLFDSLTQIMTYIMFVAPVSIITMLSLETRLYLWRISLLTDIFWITLVLNVVLIISVVVIFNMTGELRGKAEEEAKLALIEKLLKGQEEQYRDLEKYGIDLLKIKHDQKNFLYGILSDLDHGNIDDIRSCIMRELNTVENTEVPTDPSSNLIYRLVWNKTSEASAKGVTVESEYHDVREIHISPIDFAIILGNALDNAIEAAEKIDVADKRNVSVMIKVRAEQIIVIIKNFAPVGTDLNNLRSDKKGSGHGFGILSMRNIVDQYNGELIFNMEENLFTTYITMNNKNLGK